ncbi:PAS domain-containing sensor histidine kinase [uncultured Sphingomonas sp.]|uniref:sensor histidine kinase n=1 Tax=uncultured Sphingomonas sp. TaxID=158754 RepID=UPI0025E806D6|nr:PAS domain-containing sensor histidine kinase [uncultured Sphingomonas sp.]
MDSLAAYPRVSAVGWRLVIAGAALWGAIQLLPSHHIATIGLLLIVAFLALADLCVSLTRQPVLQARPTTTDDAREAEHLRALLDAVATALFVLDAQGRIVRCNRAARRMAGAMVSRLEDVAALDPRTISILQALPAGARRLVRAKDGRNLLVWCGSFTAPGAAPQRLLSLQWVAGELDAVEIEAWHAMTRVLTHEMMNALAPIVSLTESLAALPDHPPQTARALATIERRATHLLGFVERYRQLGDLPRPVPEAFDLSVLVTDVAQSTMSLEDIGIRLDLSLPTEPARIIADPELLERALANLLQNAADAVRGQPSPRITIELTTEKTETILRVRDNGPGIPVDRIDEVFVPFFTTKEGGSGIGLSLSRQIAAAHHATLMAVQSDEGACFELRIPAADGEPSAH